MSELARTTESARRLFETLDSHNRYAILYRIYDAKKPETRVKRITAYVQMLAQNATLHPPSRKRH